MDRKPCTAVVLAAGQGKRMGGNVRKQYLEIKGKPVLYYALEAFENSPLIDSVLLVVGDEEQISYCRKHIVEAYGFQKITHIITGGRERYDSVYRALGHLEDMNRPDHEAAGEKTERNLEAGYVCIHDGARPFVTEEILERCLQAVRKTGACVAAMPAKDTVKLSDTEGFAADTPSRDRVWLVQTPQVFELPLICRAYGKMMGQKEEWEREGIKITDDAMVVETFTERRVKLVEGSYRNIKITTPEDLKIAAAFLE